MSVEWMTPDAGSGASEQVRTLYSTYGQRKEMGHSACSSRLPHYFLQRRFLEDNDLLIILNTKRCRYRCAFCNLPAKCSPTFVAATDIVEQFLYVCREVKHSLSTLDRVTLSNEGSVLDTDTLPFEALETILAGVAEIRSVRCVVLETRLEFICVETLKELQSRFPRLHIDILTGFETLDQRIRDDILTKREPIETFEAGLGAVAAIGCSLTAFVLFKPDPEMTDAEAVVEAERSIDYLRQQCAGRDIPLTIRISPMYCATGTAWERLALAKSGFVPPRLSDVLELARRIRRSGLRVYIGLSSEGLAGPDGTFMAREGFSRDLLRQAKWFNDLRTRTAR